MWAVGTKLNGGICWAFINLPKMNPKFNRIQTHIQGAHNSWERYTQNHGAVEPAMAKTLSPRHSIGEEYINGSRIEKPERMFWQ